MFRRQSVLVAVVALVIGAFAATGPSAAATTVVAHGSAQQVWLTGLPGGAQGSLVNSAGQVLTTQAADAEGGLLFRNVTPGAGYVVRLADGSTSAPVTVHSTDAAPWDPGIYDQPINSSGYQYLTTRDGTQLALTVHPPTSPAGFGVPNVQLPSAGLPYTAPYPTLIEYSGYGYARPSGPENGIAAIANALGFAVVDVNMRGTGCSGGAYDFFEPLQNLDGYDVIETIARQPWVKGHKVGMLGISYGGISQLFTSQLNPPSLSAIAPLSVISAVPTTLYPGGILNTGFALQWAQERAHDALPAGPNSGQPWAWQQIQSGDQVCAANQALHGEAIPLIDKLRANSHYIPAVADPLDPISFVQNIHVPVFMACQWEDEQTGGHCPALVSHFTGTTKKWFTFTNGPHIDSLAPETLNKMYDFLELYVDNAAPVTKSAVLKAVAPVVYQTALGVPQTDLITMPVDPIQALPTYDLALSAFEAQKKVRVLFDNGATSTAGNPYPAYEQSFDSLPVPGTVAQSWYLGNGGTLNSAPPARHEIDRYTSDANALPLTDFGSKTGTGGLWGNASQWSWNWQQQPAGTGLSYVSAPLTQDTTVIGAGALYLWVRSSTPDVDLQATVSEVRPDGVETFVQNGWLRGSDRTLAATSDNVFKQPSTLLEPVLSLLPSDVVAMPSDEFTPVAIPLYYEGHAYRAGSRIRISVSAPNGTQPIWSFSETQPPTGTAQVGVAFSQNMPSRLVLPVVPGVPVPTGLPACPSLRNEPCRNATASQNLVQYLDSSVSSVLGTGPLLLGL